MAGNAVTFKSSILAGITLIREAIRSPNFTAGSSGWSINQDGSAEFNDIVIRGGSTVGGTALWYNGTPANGNLIFALAAVAGTDEFGNSYPEGFTSFDSNGDVNLSNGTAYFGDANDSLDAGSIQVGATSIQDLILTSGRGDADHQDNVQLRVISGRTAQATGSAFAPYVRILSGSSDVDLRIPGSVIRTDQSGFDLTWQNPAYAANWAGGGIFNGLGGNGLQFHLMPDDSVWLMGLVTSAAGAGTTIFTLPGGYRPAAGSTPHGPVNRNSGGVLSTSEIAITSTGQVIILPAPVAGDEYSINFRIPLRNVV